MRIQKMSLVRIGAVIRRVVGGGCLLACLLGLAFSGFAQDTGKTKDDAKHRQLRPKHGSATSGSGSASGARFSADVQAAATASNASGPFKVIHDFASPSRGAFPSNGVVLDLEGNVYGTTNGSYSDVGGGGTNNAGVVFKVDPFGHQTVLYSFTGGADGGTPNGVIVDLFGNVYGTTSNGGASQVGVVFRVSRSGKYSVLYSFTGGNDGAEPTTVILDARGNLIGMTTAGGASGAGVVFKIDTAGNESTLYTFTGGADGGAPNNSMALDAAGNLYGSTNVGGTGSGVVFKLDPSGHETVLYTFTGGSDGANPNGVTRDFRGNLYGTTSSGGDASSSGVVFKLDTTGHETVLYTFTGGNDGAGSDAGVTLDLFGNIYGTTSSGGAAGLGVAFKIDKSGNFKVLHTFARGLGGDQPDFSGVVLDLFGNVYGTGAFGGSGGQGVVFKIDPRGNESALYTFPGPEDGDGAYNNGVFFGQDGRLYGSTDYGGVHGHGVVYSLDGQGNENVLASFSLISPSGFGQGAGGVVRDPAGNVYGTTFIGQADSGYGFGVVYKVDTSGHLKLLHNFTNGADGGNPYGGVILDSKGNMYGTASGGGAAGAGVVFKLDPAGNETVLYTFTGGADGASPSGVLLQDSAGNLYGTATEGGADQSGVVFKLDTSGNETVLYSFTGGNDGAFPLAGLTRDSAGNFYGATQLGGSGGSGVVFKLDSLGNETVLYAFTGGADGSEPLWVTPVRDAAGNLYGTTAFGGAAGDGVVFRVDPSGNETVLHSFTGGVDGSIPFAGLTAGAGGKLYGTTFFGGSMNAGVVFEVKP
jgi:uncharacterized repeat protein (TIGR03803 family)